MWEILFGRGIAGLGGAGMMSLVSIVIAGNIEQDSGLCLLRTLTPLKILSQSARLPLGEVMSTWLRLQAGLLGAQLAELWPERLDGDGMNVLQFAPDQADVRVGLSTANARSHC